MALFRKQVFYFLFVQNKYFVPLDILVKTNTGIMVWFDRFVIEKWGLWLSLPSWVDIDVDIGVRIENDSTVLQELSFRNIFSWVAAFYEMFGMVENIRTET